MPLVRWTFSAAMMSACVATIPASAQGNLQDQLAVCARIAKNSARIECYDSVARASSQATPAANSGSSSIAAPREAPLSLSAIQPARSASFGAEQIDRPRAELPKNDRENALDVVVASSRDNGISMWTVNLTDGAVWRMTEGVTDFRPPAPQEKVTIHKGALGGYLMQVGKQAAVRVRRIR